MYGMIDRGYGIIVEDNRGIHLNELHIPLLKDLVVLEGEYSLFELEDWSLEDLIEYVCESSYCWIEYSGCGQPPIAIGISLYSWPYWDLESENGILQFAKLESPTDEEVDAWNSDIPENVREVISRYGIEPKVFWTSSTS